MELGEWVGFVIEPPAGCPHHGGGSIAPRLPGLLGGALGARLIAEPTSARALGHGLNAARVSGLAYLVRRTGRDVVLRRWHAVEHACGEVRSPGWGR